VVDDIDTSGDGGDIPGDPVAAVATGLPTPSTAGQIASVAGRDRETTVARLNDLVAGDRLVAFPLDGGVYYYPDPVTAYLEATGCPPERPSEKAAVTTVRRAVSDWERSVAVGSIEGIVQYHHAARLIASSRLRRGFDVYDEEWDVLVVLDTCRVDGLRAAVDRLDGHSEADVADRFSVGSQTAEWLCSTFTTDREDELSRTGYVSGNGWVKGVFEDGMRPDAENWFPDGPLPTGWTVADAGDFGAVVHAWRQGRGEYTREVPWEPHPDPETVTDHAIALARERPDLDRLVVHYKQPHAPYTVAARREGRTDLTAVEAAPFDYLSAGGNYADVREAYLTDLRAAVDEVAALCRNVDGTVAVTADHGEAFGENGEYGHRPAMLHPQVRRVPWLTLSATDERTRDPDLEEYESTDRGIDAQLEALGYR